MSNVGEARKAEVPQTDEFINRIRSLARSKSGELWADQEVIDKLRTYKSLCASQHEVITGYEEQEATLVEALQGIRTRLTQNTYGMGTDIDELARAALEAAGVELP